MYKRQQQLADIKEYIENVNKETTLLLQNLQWDHKHLVESIAMVSCKYEPHHRIPLDKRDAHERQCYLRQQGYNKADTLLPDPIDPGSNTVVKLSKEDIKQIINRASASNPLFKRGVVCPGAEPLSAERLQQVYTADERRAIHDAVVASAPSCHDLADLALVNHGPQATKEKSRAEILAELRDMKRRRTKYRVAAKTRNYSDMLRDVIKTQMELYAEAKGIFIKTEYGSKTHGNITSGAANTNVAEGTSSVVIKQERMSPETETYRRDTRKYRERSENRDKRKHDDKRRYKDFRRDREKHCSSERRRCDDDQSKRDKHHKIKQERDTGLDRRKHEHFRQGTSKDSQKYSDDRSDDRRNQSRDNQVYSSKDIEYDADYREHSKTKKSLIEDVPRSSSKYYDKKRAEHEGRREQKKQYDVQVGEGKDYEDDHPNERKRRKRY